MQSLLLSLVFAAAPSAPNPKDVEIAATRGAVEIRSLTLLDVDVERGFLGLKVVATAKPYTEDDHSATGAVHVEPSSCDYAGMKKTPLDGVTLALMHAGADDTGSWEVYAPPHEKCTEPAVSKARLAQAKAAFAQVNMRMDKEIKPTATPNAQGEMSLKVGERTVVLATRETDESCFAEAPPEKYKALGCDPVTGDRVHTLTFLADGKQLHESVRVYPGASAGSAHVEVLGAFVRGSKVLLLQKITTEVGMAGPALSATDLRLSPLLDLAR
jgi:hypothetical protein